MEERQILIDELHKPVRKRFPRRRVKLIGINELLMVDLVEMIPYAKQNKNYKYMLVVIDGFSKRGYIEPLKSKKAEDVTRAMEKILKRIPGRPVSKIQADQGGEFFNGKFLALMKKHNIHLYHTYTTVKASMIERFNRTFKGWLFKKFSMQGNYKWLDLIEPLLAQYNNRVHRTIGMKPIDVRPEHENTIRLRLAMEGAKIQPTRKKFAVGDYVRLSKQKSLFEKSYLPNWGTELMIVDKIQNTRPITYLLRDLHGNKIAGAFYAEEIQKTRVKDLYLVERVLKRKGNRAYVKFLGLDASNNSWVDAKSIV